MKKIVQYFISHSRLRGIESSLIDAKYKEIQQQTTDHAATLDPPLLRINQYFAVEGTKSVNPSTRAHNALFTVVNHLANACDKNATQTANLATQLTQKGLIQVLSAPARQLSLGQGSLDQGQQAAVTSIDSVGQASQQPTNVPISKCLVRAAAGVLADSRTDHVSETESEGVPVEDKPVVIPSANIGEVD